MIRLYIDITATIDDEAANLCRYVPSPRSHLPLVLHLIQAISVLKVEYLFGDDPWAHSGPLVFTATSWTESEMSEKSMLEHCREECQLADEIVTLAGERFELPILFGRSLVHAVPAAFMNRHRRHGVWRFHDGPVEATTPRLTGLPSLAELCAPMQIDFQPPGDGDTFAQMGEARAKAVWLLDEYWTSGGDPEMVRERREMLVDLS